MTPDQAKKPLPSSASVLFLEQPKTQYEWRYVLKVIKIEYQKGQWQKCLVRCNQLLKATCSPLPLHVTYLYFYGALSEEAIARQMHNMSMAKIRALQLAKSCFEKAISSLPLPDTSNSIIDSGSVDSASDIDDTASLEDSASSVGSPQLIDLAKRSSVEAVDQTSPTIGILKPLPLQICKAVRSGSSSFNEKKAFFEARLNVSKSRPSVTPATKSLVLDKPLPAPPSTERPLRKGSDPCPRPIISPNSTIPWLQSHARARYNEQLQDFSQMLFKHVYFVDEAIAATQEAQAIGRHRMIKERKSNEDDEKSADLTARIVELKTKGWTRERFIPERYQKLCERALAEL